MFKGLATSLSSAVSSLDQAAREVVSISLEDGQDDEEGDFDDEDGEGGSEEGEGDVTAAALRQAAGALWNRSSGVIASVTSEVASAVTDEIGGVSAAVISVVAPQPPAERSQEEEDGRDLGDGRGGEMSGGSGAGMLPKDATGSDSISSHLQDASHAVSVNGISAQHAASARSMVDKLAVAGAAKHDLSRVGADTYGARQDETGARERAGRSSGGVGAIPPEWPNGGDVVVPDRGTGPRAPEWRGRPADAGSAESRERALKEEKAQLIDDLNAAVQRCAALQEANAGLEETVATLTRGGQQAAQQLSGQLQSLGDECHELKEMVKMSEQDNAALQQTCMELQQRLQPTVTELQAQSSALAEAKASVAAADLEKEELQERVKGLENLVRQCSEREAEAVRLGEEQAKRAESLASRLVALQSGDGEGAALLQQFEQEKSRAAQRSEECDRLSSQLVEARRESSQLRAADEREQSEARLLSESVAVLTQIVGVAPEGSRSDRVKSVCGKVREVMAHSSRLVERVAQLEAWKEENLEERLRLQQQVRQLQVVGGGGGKEVMDRLHREVEELKIVVEQGVAARRVAESECKAMLDENQGLRALVREAHASREEAIEAAVEQAQRGFEQEVAMLRGALDKLKVRVAETSEDSVGLEEAVIGKDEELEALRGELEWERDDRRREREEWSEARAAREADIARIKEECRGLQEQIDSLEGANEVLELERDKTIEERERMEAILESFHEQDTLDSSLHLEKAKREAEVAQAALREREAQIVSLNERLAGLTDVEREAAQLRAEADKLRSETAMSGRLTDEMTARMDQMADQLRKARMFAASEEHYVDRRLVSNVVVSYFDGMKAGTDEVLKLLCIILGMTDEQKRMVERGHTRSRQAQGGVGRGLYGLLTAPIMIPSRGWEAITEAEIGQEWVQFLIDETS